MLKKRRIRALTRLGAIDDKEWVKKGVLMNEIVRRGISRRVTMLQGDEVPRSSKKAG